MSETDPEDLVSVYVAERQSGVADSTLHGWIKEGRISNYGSGGIGKRVTVLVSLSEVEAAASWRAESVSAREAGRLLTMADGRVVSLCDEGVLPYRRFGRNYEIERAAVERLAAERSEMRERNISFKAAEREEGLPSWVLANLEAAGRLDVHRGDGGVRLVDRRQLVAVSEELRSQPEECPGCGEPVEEPGRTWHRKCTGPAASRKYWLDPAERENRRVAAATRSSEYQEQIRAHVAQLLLLTIDEVATRVGRDESQVSDHAKRLKVGRRIDGTAPHGGLWVFTEEECQAIARRIAESATGVLHRDPQRRARWYWRRFKSPKMAGRLASLIAAEKGKKVGAPSLEEAEVRRVAAAALDLYRRDPDLPKRQVLDVLIAHIEGRDKLSHPQDGRLRKRRDPVLQAAERRITRRLQAACKLPDLGETLLARHFG